MAVNGRVQGPPQDGDVEQYSRQAGQWVLTQAPSYFGAINFTDPNGTVRAQIDSISGDLWLLSNAIWNPNDGAGGNFYRIDRTHAAFGLQLQGQGFIPGEPNLGYYVAGCTVWVAQPESYDLIRGGGQFANPIFNVIGGWELGTTVTQQRQLTVGGGGIEIDGYGLLPYGRIINNDTGTVLHKRIVGNVENVFTDLSGYDDPTQESWIWGYVQEYNPANGQPVPSTSRWSVAYLPPNTNPTSGIFYEYIKVTPAGSLATVEVTRDPTTSLGVATKHYVDNAPALPAPVTSGSTAQFFTTPSGETWVARNGVNGGNWARANAVLYCRCYRSAAYTSPAQNTPIVFDAAADDVYGLFANPGITTPIAGQWLVGASVEIAPTAATDTISFYMNVANAAQIRSAKASSNSTTGTLRSQATHVFNQTAAGTVGLGNEDTTPGRAVNNNDGRTFLWAKYVGS